MRSLGDLARRFGNLAAGGYRDHLVPTLNLIGETIKAEVENEIGTYQGAIGPFPATAPLSPDTLRRKTQAGLGRNGPDTPLYATGQYHSTIQISVNRNDLWVEIGTDREHVIAHELGTSRIPPRPIFGPATLRSLPRLLPAIHRAAGQGIAGGVWTGLSAEGVTETRTGYGVNITL